MENMVQEQDDNRLLVLSEQPFDSHYMEHDQDVNIGIFYILCYSQNRVYYDSLYFTDQYFYPLNVVCSCMLFSV